MYKKIISFVMIFTFILMSNNVYAKWWIFGKSDGAPEINKVFVAGVNIEDVEDVLTLYKDSLTAGDVVIKGFVSKSKSRVALAQVSLDDGNTWEKAEIAKNGNFVYRFKPEENKEYVLVVKIMDATGKKSDPSDIPSIKILYKNLNVSGIVKNVFLDMISSYQNMDTQGFMDFVSSEFRGDSMELENAIEEDFSRFSSITLDVVIDNIVSYGNEVKITFKFIWRGISLETGDETILPQDTSICTFIIAGDSYKLIDIAAPVAFGLSKASVIATAPSTPDAHPSEKIIKKIEKNYDDDDDDFEEEEEEEEVTYIQGTITLTTENSNDAVYSEGFIFSTQTRVTNDYAVVDPADLIVEDGSFFYSSTGGGLRITDPTTAPESGYKDQEPGFGELAAGQYYAVKTQDGNYAIIEITDYTETVHTWTATFDYKYNPDGSRNF